MADLYLNQNEALGVLRLKFRQPLPWGLRLSSQYLGARYSNCQTFFFLMFKGGGEVKCDKGSFEEIVMDRLASTFSSSRKFLLINFILILPSFYSEFLQALGSQLAQNNFVYPEFFLFVALIIELNFPARILGICLPFLYVI